MGIKGCVTKVVDQTVKAYELLQGDNPDYAIDICMEYSYNKNKGSHNHQIHVLKVCNERCMH